MKNLKKIITVIALNVSTVLSLVAADPPPSNSKVNKQLRTEIISLLGDKITVQIINESSQKLLL
jgi:hypothetical protein